MNLVLIGYRGTGKSAVAGLVAGRLGRPWFDADAEIETRAGKSISQIFDQDGEAVFRDLESQVVADLAKRDRVVVALGGGSVMRAENRAAIAQNSYVVWLTASAETIHLRLQADAATAVRRPKLTAKGGITEIIATLDARRQVYRQCAQLEVDTEDKTPAQVADAILAQANLEQGLA